jgi:hypothetical protein
MPAGILFLKLETIIITVGLSKIKPFLVSALEKGAAWGAVAVGRGLPWGNGRMRL